MEFLSWLIGIPVVTSACTYIAKRVVDKSFESSMEQFKSSLEIQRHQFNTKFSTLHENQFTILTKLYSRYYELELALQKLTSPYQGSEWSNTENAKESIEIYLDCVKNLELGSIFLSENLYQQIYESLMVSKEVIVEMSQATFRDRHNYDLVEARQKWQAAQEKAEKSVVQKRKLLVKSLRIQFGLALDSSDNSLEEIQN